MWLAPVQAIVLPIADRHREMQKAVHEQLATAGLRADVDERQEKIGYKIREAQMQKIPYAGGRRPWRREEPSACVTVQVGIRGHSVRAVHRGCARRSTAGSWRRPGGTSPRPDYRETARKARRARAERGMGPRERPSRGPGQSPG